ncbi:type I restriction enzyme HsdR N-terminal domain-containing protein [Lutibacter sp.]
MHLLNLPTYKFKIKNTKNKYTIFDIVRKKYVSLTPEEWVRQHLIHYLVEEKKYPVSLIAIEKQLTINNLTKRTDILVFNSEGTPEIIVECKAPSIKITQRTFDQIARYNLKLNANYLIVSNGLKHYYCKMDLLKKEYVFLDTIPNYNF